MKRVFSKGYKRYLEEESNKTHAIMKIKHGGQDFELKVGQDVFDHGVRIGKVIAPLKDGLITVVINNFGWAYQQRNNELGIKKKNYG